MSNPTSTLALVGGEEFAPDFASVHAQLLSLTGRSNPTVAYLPTAIAPEGAERVAWWSTQARNALEALGATVEIVLVLDTTAANQAMYVSQVQRADVIYLGGGMPEVYRDILAHSRVWKAILQRYESGAVLIGASAGAMILGEHMLQRAYPGEYPPSQWATGFGLLPRCGIAPHFDTFGDTWINKIKQTLPAGATLIGIDEQTAYVRHGDHDWTILGHGQVTLHTL